MFFTINDLIRMKSIEGLSLFGGESGITNTISNTNIMDNPDTFDWLMPGDLVLTTGYVFKDDTEFQVKVIKELSEINCAGLAIKTRKYFGEMPKAMVEAANQYNLPLIEIPQNYSLAQISNAVNKEIFKAHDSLLQKSLDIHESLTEVTLKGGGLDEIAKAVVQLINNAVIIVDSKWNLLTYVEHPHNPYPLEKILTLNKKEKVFPMKMTEDVPDDVASLKKSIKRKYEADGKTIICRIMPIAAINEIYGYIIVWETTIKMSKIDYVALETASTVAALERIKTKEIEEVKHQIRRDFFDDLLTGKIESINSINSLAEMHGMDTTKNYVCMIVKVNGYDSKDKGDIIVKKRNLRNKIERMLLLIEELSEEKKINVVSISRRNQVILFIPMEKTKTSKEAKDFTKEFGKDFYELTHKTLSPIEINIGIGKLYDNILKLDLSFSEAQEVVKMGKKLSRNNHILHFEDFIIYHLLESGTSRQELENFYENTIAELVRYDLENKTNLVGTLEQYFAYKGNISEASKELFIHRNTFIYRLDKIKTILNTDLKDAEESLEIQLAIRVMHLLKIH
ncbi:PucR family transcriptional regulator [Natronincola ferrireducens]|uniref:Purine catabolism regulatory protein n=1 Tax=Natronincola ferrireducens TaxID=393762 RepID=A0A1G9G073_9FIRM|nr:PucR family transcriptional regulator ligand-binding domain-containing protein [Natronincola ferrireducens]SDK94020.1 purine catabolism regulatory protein [Natronincola ferrireducens]